MMQLVTIAVADEPSAWADAGFVVHDDVVSVGPVSIAVGQSELAWAIDQHPDSIDAIPTCDPRPANPKSVHPNGVTGFDHVVVSTGDLERTRAAFAAARIELRRTRTIALPDGEREQSFYWLGQTLLELVGPSTASGEPASIWGLALIARDLEATVAFLGDCSSPLHDAVQPGRSIATLRTEAVGMSLPIAIMSPHRSAGGESSNSTA